MSLPRSPAALDALRRQVRLIELADSASGRVLPFGVEAIDERLPGQGLAMGALHEVAGGAEGALHGAAAASFAAGILARADGPVLWCLRQRDLFAPALAQAGLPPKRVIFAEAGDEAAILGAMEEGLKYRGLAGVVGEVAKLSMTASRRLQLSAEKSGKNSLDIAGLLKIKGSEIQQRYAELMMLAAGPFALPFIEEAMEAGWQGDFPGGSVAHAPLASTYFNMRKTTIYGGSNEVQRNIVAQTLLG